MDEYSKTIVGGRGQGHTTRQDHPQGIEILIKKAKANPAFAQTLLNDPAEAAAEIDLELTETERAILRHTPGHTLRTMIEHTSMPARLAPVFRRARKAASLAAIVALSTAAPVLATAAGEMEAPIDIGAATEDSIEKMLKIQEALALYFEANGDYPTTQAWIVGNPLEDYVDQWMLYDLWNEKFRYEGVVQGDIVVNYLLESLGESASSPHDDIPCPVDPDLHRFPADAEPASDAGADQ